MKDSVFNIVNSPVMQQHWTTYITQEKAQNGTSSSPHRREDDDPDADLKPVYVHGESALFSDPHPLEPIYRTWTRLTHAFWLFLSSQQVSSTISALETSPILVFPSARMDLPPRPRLRVPSSAPSTNKLIAMPICESITS